MTCAVAYRRDRKIYIAADKQATDVGNHFKSQYKSPKVFEKDDLVIAVSGSFAVLQFVKHKLTFTRTEKDTEKFLIMDFCDALKKQLKENDIDSSDTNIIVCVDRRIFVVDCDFHVGEPDTKYISIGSAKEVALGAFFVADKMGLDPEVVVDYAMKAANNVNITVSNKYDMMVIE